MIFPPPEPNNAFRARWRAKVRRATRIWERAVTADGWRAERRARLAHRVLDGLMRQRDAIVAGHHDPSHVSLRLARATTPTNEKPPIHDPPPRHYHDRRRH